MAVGGSYGHGGLWGLDVDEGTYESDGGRYWDVSVKQPDEVRSDSQAAREALAERQATERLERDTKAIVDVMIKTSDGDTKGSIKDRSALNSRQFSKAWADLLDQNMLETVTLLKGNNANMRGSNSRKRRFRYEQDRTRTRTRTA